MGYVTCSTETRNSLPLSLCLVLLMLKTFFFFSTEAKVSSNCSPTQTIGLHLPNLQYLKQRSNKSLCLQANFMFSYLYELE